MPCSDSPNTCRLAANIRIGIERALNFGLLGRAVPLVCFFTIAVATARAAPVPPPPLSMAQTSGKVCCAVHAAQQLASSRIPKLPKYLALAPTGVQIENKYLLPQVLLLRSIFSCWSRKERVLMMLSSIMLLSITQNSAAGSFCSSCAIPPRKAGGLLCFKRGSGGGD